MNLFAGLAALAVLALSLIAGSAQGQTSDPPVSADGIVEHEPIWLDLRQSSYPLLIVDVVLDGRTLPAMLDTGSSSTKIDAPVARSLGAELRPHGTTNVFGQQVETQLMEFSYFEFGDFRQLGGSMIVIDLGHIRWMTGEPFAMLIGADVLAAYALHVDWDNNRVRLLPSGSPGLAGEEIPLKIGPFGVFQTGIAVNGLSIGLAAVDTGADQDLAVQSALLPALGVKPERTTDLVTTVVGRTELVNLFRADSVRLGGMSFKRVSTNASEIVMGPDRVIQARIGMGFLQRFNFLMDPQAGRMIVAPRATPARTYPFSTSGVVGHYSPEGFVLYHVMRGSPAARAGLKVNDRICTIDGQKVHPAWRNGPERAWSTGKPGRRVDLGLCDGRRMTLTLEEFY